MSIFDSGFVKTKVKSVRNNIERKAEVAPEQWLREFMAIYEQCAPLIHMVTRPSSCGQAFDRKCMIEARRSFPPLLAAVRELPVPSQTELQDIKHSLENTLSMCIKAGRLAMKMADDTAYGTNLVSKMYSKKIVRYRSDAAVYYASLLEKLENINQDAN